MNYNEEYFYAESVLHQLSKQSGGPVMYMRADGPKSVTDAAQLEDIWDFYIGKCPLDIINAFHEWFPQKKQLLDEEMGYYIYAEVINVSEGVHNVNG